MKHKFRLILAIALIVITIVVFSLYISTHTYLIRELFKIPKTLIIWLFILFTLWFGALVLIMWASMLLFQKKLSLKENVLLNAYSTLVNFFIPGQGGIVVRGYYLKKNKKIPVRNYIFVSLIYFMFYAILSGLFLFLFNQTWWKTLGAVILISLFSLLVLFLYQKKAKLDYKYLHLKYKFLLYLFLATFVQLVIQTLIFGVELHSVNSSIKISQMITYTGAANFALFVALTPGAIGIRESFLLLSHKLHHISSANIVSANIIDRSMFILFLGIIFVVTIGLHTNYKNYVSNQEETDN